MRILIVNSANRGVSDYVAPIQHTLDGMGIGVNPYIVENDRFPYIKPDEIKSDFSGVIVSASPRGDDIVEDRAKKLEWIKDSRGTPILGICAGHQIVGHLWGAELIKDDQSELGYTTVKVLKDDPLFEGYGREIQVYQGHNDSILMPDDFDLIATNDRCENQFMRSKSGPPIWTGQCHIEISNRRMIENFAKYCKTYRR